MTSRAGDCSRASTTSDSRFVTPTPSRRSKRVGLRTSRPPDRRRPGLGGERLHRHRVLGDDRFWVAETSGSFGKRAEVDLEARAELVERWRLSEPASAPHHGLQEPLALERLVAETEHVAGPGP